MLARGVKFYQCGGPEVLKLEHIDVPEPGPDEVRIQVEAFGLNRSEALFREGLHPCKPILPSRIGYEASGRVESVGPGVTEFTVGEAVSTLPIIESNRCGAYGELFTVPVSVVVHAPPELSPIESAALWSSYVTAYAGLVELVSIKPGDFVVVTAASSSVGPPAIQIINMLGAKAIAVTRRRAKSEVIRALGAHDVIVSDEEDLVSRVGGITGGAGARVVFDPIGGPVVTQLAEITAPYGTIILYGRLDPNPTPFPLSQAVGKNLSLLGFAMYLHDRPERNARAIEFIRRGVARGLLRPLIAKQYTLDEIVAAATYLDSMQQIGKVVVSTR